MQEGQHPHQAFKRNNAFSEIFGRPVAQGPVYQQPSPQPQHFGAPLPAHAHHPPSPYQQQQHHSPYQQQAPLPQPGAIVGGRRSTGSPQGYPGGDAPAYGGGAGQRASYYPPPGEQQPSYLPYASGSNGAGIGAGGYQQTTRPQSQGPVYSPAPYPHGNYPPHSTPSPTPSALSPSLSSSTSSFTPIPTQAAVPPPRLPELPVHDDFLGFDSARPPDHRESFDSTWSGNSQASGSGGQYHGGYPPGAMMAQYPPSSRGGSPRSLYDSGLPEEVDGFDPVGPRVSSYQYFDQPGAPHSRRNSNDSDRPSLYRGNSIVRPLLNINPSMTSISSSNYYPYSNNSPATSNTTLLPRRSSESLRVMPTQPKGPYQQDRAFSFSGERPDPRTFGRTMSSIPSSISSMPSIPPSSPSSVIPARAPVVYPALLSRVADAFKSRITVAERVKDGLVYSDTFDGRDAVDKIAYIIKTTDRNLALLLGRALDAQKFFHDVTYDHRLRDSPAELYQFKERLGFVPPEGESSPVDGYHPAAGQQQPHHSHSGSSSGRPRRASIADTVASDDASSMPSGVFTLLTDCYSPTCTRDRLCYSIACPRRLEQQARLNLKPKPGLQRSISSESLGDDFREPGSLWIHSVPQEVADATSDQEKKRQECLNEVFYTERDFVRDMEYLRDTWIKPLRTSNIIPESRREDLVTQVFWNVLEIYAVNLRLADMLNKRQKQAHVVDRIGDIFLEMVPHFSPFVKYGAHQLFGKYEFEKEKGANPAFAKFVDETERLPESRKLELNGYLTKPTTRLARYPLLLESCLKYTPDDNPDKVMLPKVIKLVREFLNKVNVETGKSENRFNLAQLDQQLVFKNGEAVDLRLRDEEREMIYKGPLKKRGGAQGESAELTVYLFDHAILMVKQKSKNEQSKVYRKPIPLELLVVAPLEDSVAARGGTVRPKSLMSRSSTVKYLANPPPGVEKNNKQGFAMTFIHLGKRGYQITLWSASWAGRKKWLEKIEGRQQELRDRSLVFETIPLSSGYFVGTNRVTCAAPFDNGNRMVYGTDNGVYLSNLRDTNKVPVKVISVPNVTQLDVLEEQGILIVLADKAVQTFFVDNLDPGDAVGAARRARKISSHATFFKAGQCLGRTLVCVVKSGSVSSTIKTLEPVDQARGKKQPAIRKFLQGSNEALRVFKEFYIPTESSSVHFLKSRLCVGCTKGFEIVDLETLDTQGLLDPADSSLDFVQRRENAKPVAIYRVDGDFLLCYDEFAFYVNKNGWRARSNWIIQWEGNPTSFALHYPYVLAFEPTFVEVRHVESGALMQIIPGNSLRCLFADTPPSSSSSAANPYYTTIYSNNLGQWRMSQRIYSTRQSSYLRIGPYQVLQMILYLEEDNVPWMSDSVLERMLMVLKERIPRKLSSEVPSGSRSKIEATKAEKIDIYRGADYQMDKQLVANEPPPPPRLPKSPSKKSRIDPEGDSAPLDLTNDVPETDADEEDGERPSKRQAVEVYIKEEEEDDPLDAFASPKDKEGDLYDDEEKPDLKPKLKVNYQGYSIYDRALVVIVEPYPPLSEAQKKENRRVVAPTEIRQLSTSVAPEAYRTSTSAPPRRRNQMPLFRNETTPLDEDDLRSARAAFRSESVADEDSSVFGDDELPTVDEIRRRARRVGVRMAASESAPPPKKLYSLFQPRKPPAGPASTPAVPVAPAPPPPAASAPSSAEPTNAFEPASIPVEAKKVGSEVATAAEETSANKAKEVEMGDGDNAQESDLREPGGTLAVTQPKLVACNQSQPVASSSRSNVIVIPDSPPPAKPSSTFLPLSDLYKTSRLKRQANQPVEPRWPTAEEHGAYHEVITPAVPRSKERWIGSGSGKGKEKADDTDIYFDRLTSSFAGYTPTSLQLSPFLDAPQLAHHSLANVKLLAPTFPPHPALNKLAAPLLSSNPPYSYFARRTDPVEAAPNPSWKQQWSMTYAPQNADEVLGEVSGKSAKILKEWLLELALWKDEQLPGSKRPRKIRTKVDKKRKKRRNDDSDLDDFIASDEEEEEMDDGSDSGSDGEGYVPRGGASRKQTFPTLSNLILLYGPTASGKTSTVHAIATELGWEVFEVNAGQGRRTAKDIERLVGDVSKNHVIHGPSNGSKSPTKKAADPFAMFRQAAKQPAHKRASSTASSVDEPEQRKLGTQSLILFDEVDVLYLEEENFWSGLVNLVQHSKRPVILTCSDTSQIPFHDLALQEISSGSSKLPFLRFAAPEPSIAVPFLQLVALSEGHVISPEALTKLYTMNSLGTIDVATLEGPSFPLTHPTYAGIESSPDLRKSLNQLQFECQWAVGSTNGGVDWMGLDIPEEERANQTAWSVGTYLGKSGKSGGVIVEAKEEKELRGVEGMLVGAEALSFVDAYVARRSAVQFEIDEADVFDAGPSQLIGPPPINTRPNPRHRHLPHYTRESEFVDVISSLASGCLGREVNMEVEQEEVRSRQRSTVVSASQLTWELVEPPVPTLPHPVTFVEYLPAIRLITAADAIHAAAQDGENDGVVGQRGLRRSTRGRGNVHSSHDPRLTMDSVELKPQAGAPPLSRSGSHRPDHSSVPIAPMGSTTPLISPPASPSDSTKPQFSAPYGGYGSSAYDDEKDSLLGRGGLKKRNPFADDAPSSNPLVRLIVIFVVVVGALVLLSHGSSPRSKITQSLSPFLPASFVAFIGSTGVTNASPHPIIPLLTHANDKWASLVSTQSTTFDRASKTYKSRYGLTPPPGFDKWFAFATQGRNHSLVDEYDQLMNDLAPYRELTAAELKRRTAELAQVPGISIVSVRNGVAQVHSKSGKWAPALAFQQMLAAFVRDLPDMDIAINEKPEGRVLPRRQKVVLMEDYGLEGVEEKAPNMTDPFVRPSLDGFTAEWSRDGTVWDTFRRSCPTDSAARRLVESVRSAEAGVGAASLHPQGRATNKNDASQTRRKVSGLPYPPARELTFNSDVDAAWDLCASPSMHSLHSAYFSDQRAIEHLYPVFSPSKPAGYGDILIPSHHYWSPSSEFTYEWEMKRGRTKEPTDLDWSLKKPSVYWRGKVTRGADTPPGRANSFQKQRLVKMANQGTTGAERVLVAFDPLSAGLLSASMSLPASNKAISDIAMACDPNLGECTYLRSLGYRVEPPGPLSDAWHHKYVLDLDEIGFSPRFFALMESKSAVIKSSVQREFWSDWIVPWKHYIPLSSAYAELYNIATFFSGFPSALTSNETFTPTVLTAPNPVPALPTSANGEPFQGDRMLQDIAEAGREWRQSYVRKADMECYVYRLMIEWAAMIAEE
ncbi:Rho guanyl-nucleotide exchange factor [Pseudohyphozyma bogoriensis]|nr:Rho guanyl-nucleotide exchange factor [Pseudohyphozyma bogoriensis]